MKLRMMARGTYDVPVPVAVDLRLHTMGRRKLIGTLRGEPAELERLHARGRVLVTLGDGEYPCRCTGLSEDGGVLDIESTGLLPAPVPEGDIWEM